MSESLRTHFKKSCDITDDQLDHLMQYFTPKKFRKHEFIIKEGDTVKYNYFVVKGCLKCFAIDENGKEYILQFATENWWICDYKAYWNGTPATVNIDCLEDCELMSVSMEDHERICDELHAVEHFFRKKANAGYVALQQRILSLIKMDAAERYDLFINQYADLIQRIPKQLIAGYLGVSRETLSRLNLKK
jgi:CRP-like cAMP-binding protein